MGGAPSSIPIASSYKKTGFQMSNKNAGFFSNTDMVAFL